MARTANEERPAELLESMIDYLGKHGVADLSLRPLAKAVGSSPRVLLYYFGSKEELVNKALAHLRERQRTLFGQALAGNLDSPAEACRAVWKHMSAPEFESHFRLFFEVYGLALRHPKRFHEFLRSAIGDWLEFLDDLHRREGWGRNEARAVSTVVLAGFRGFMLDYCATQDRKRLDHAVGLWLAALNSLAPKSRPLKRKSPGSSRPRADRGNRER